MCGIVGAFFEKEAKSFPIQAMAEAIKHRGPDDEGYLLLNVEDGTFEERRGKDTHPELRRRSIEEGWSEGIRLIFGHRRLSIIDLSSAGHQPMADGERQVWITYNGEIYNYLELRRELEELGIRFFSHTDTEVILESYKMWGEECLQKFNGMWAFALWDSRRKILFCARDRFGVKPFYYARVGHDFFFASEIRALLLAPQIPKEISEEAVFNYLILSLCQNNSQTFFSKIQSLEPGHCLTVKENGRFELRRWYFFPDRVGIHPYRKECQDEFLERLNESIRLRLRSDVRVGTCLSGGLDSSSIVCLAARQMSSPIRTFSSCFEDRLCDERAFIEPVVHKIGANAQFIFPQGKDFWEEWPELIQAQEEPFGSTSLYAHWCVMREVSRHEVPVLLNGQGGDELLGGYPRYRLNRAASLLLQGNPQGFFSAFKDPRVFVILAFNLLPSHLQSTTAFLASLSEPFLQKDFLEKHRRQKAEYLRERGRLQRNLHESLRSDFFTYILPSLLRYEDKNSMHFSTEIRLPFLDYTLVEWVFGLEEAAKIEGGVTKRILRESLRGILPESVRLRSDKMGFATPEEMWLNLGRPVISHFFEHPSEAAIAPWIRVDKMKRIIEHGSSWNGLLWRIINLEMWLRIFFYRKITPLSSLARVGMTD